MIALYRLIVSDFMPFLETPTGKLFYADKRGNNPLIMVHGAGASHLTWPAQIRRLRGIRTIGVDLPGHGRSDPSSCKASIAYYAKRIQYLIDCLQITEAFIVGHSMGGAIAQMLAVEIPERVTGLILIGTGAVLQVNPILLELARNDRSQMVALLDKWMWGPSAPDSLKELSRQEMMALSSNILFEDYAACAQFDFTDTFTSIQQPVLVIGGTHDKMVPLGYSKALADGIPNAQLAEIENAGHMIHLERPNVVAGLIEGWIAQHA